MGTQAYIMAIMFGMGFQYGKRKISSLTNKEFNNITPELLFKQNLYEMKKMIPSIQESLGIMGPLTRTVLDEFKKMAIEIAKFAVDETTGAVKSDIQRIMSPELIFGTSAKGKKMQKDFADWLKSVGNLDASAEMETAMSEAVATETGAPPIPAFTGGGFQSTPSPKLKTSALYRAQVAFAKSPPKTTILQKHNIKNMSADRIAIQNLTATVKYDAGKIKKYKIIYKTTKNAVYNKQVILWQKKLKFHHNQLTILINNFRKKYGKSP